MALNQFQGEWRWGLGGGGGNHIFPFWMLVDWAFADLFNFMMLSCNYYDTFSTWTLSGGGGKDPEITYTLQFLVCIDCKKSLLACSYVLHVQKRNWYIPNGSVFPFPVLMTKAVVWHVCKYHVHLFADVCIGQFIENALLESSSTYCWCITKLPVTLISCVSIHSHWWNLVDCFIYLVNNRFNFVSNTAVW